MKGGRMWEWWRKVEQEYREKRQKEDEQRREERRGELSHPVAARQGWGIQSESASWTTQELLAEAERRWGVEFPWEEAGMKRPSERRPEVVVEIGRPRQIAEGRLQKYEGSDCLVKGALLLVLTGKFRSG